MPQDHDDFQTEPVRGLPEDLPEGEHILWQGQPDWWALTKEALSFWWVAGYFAFLFAWRTVGGAATESGLRAQRRRRSSSCSARSSARCC
jgi:hypothetical protein